MYEAYVELANAIVWQASKDYKTVKLRMKRVRTPGWKLESKMSDLMKFFKSDWYSVLTRVNSTYILSKLDAEVLEELECPKKRGKQDGYDPRQ